jgi:hypothetical protein
MYLQKVNKKAFNKNTLSSHKQDPDPDPLQSKNSGAKEYGGSIWSHGGPQTLTMEA